MTHLHHHHPLVKLRGQVMIISMIFLAVILILASSLFSNVTQFVKFGAKSIQEEEASALAEAGIERALWQLNETAGVYTGETNTQLGQTGTFTVTVEDKAPNTKTITSTGYVPNSTDPKGKREIKVDVNIDNTIINFAFAVQVGTGGIFLDNNSLINGSVYSNKTGASITGGNGSTITGDAYAVGTIGDPPNVQGLRFQNQPASTLPAVNYQQWKDDATAGGTVTCTPTCSLNGTTNIGPKKYEGNLTFENGANYTMTGPIYVTGRVFLDNGSTLKLSDTFGSVGSVLITDGKVYVDNGATIIPTNSIPKGYILVVTTNTTDTTSECHENNALNDAVCIDNNGANAVFYALEGGATLDNNSFAVSLVAKSLTLDNSATMTYDTGLASTQFSSGPGGSWQLKRGSYKFFK